MKYIPFIATCCLFPFFQLLSAQCPSVGPNLIVNGDFEQGYYGFTSDFGRGQNNATLGNCGTQGWILVAQIDPHVSPTCQYYPTELSALYGGPGTETSSDPNHPSNTAVTTLATCNAPMNDHTTGSGFFLTIDPDNIPGRAFWKQKVPVCANTDYVFSAWVRNVAPGCGLPAPFFHFEVGGVPINPPTSYPDCFWVQTAAQWNSGNVQGDVWIELVNDQPGCIANDVAIDDVFFGICGAVSLSCEPEFRFCEGALNGPLLLSGTAQGFAFSQYQWQRFHAATATWDNINGASMPVYTLDFPDVSDAGYYRLTASAHGNAFDPACLVASDLIRVEVLPVYSVVETVNICPGESYNGNSTAGIYVDTFLSTAGCDSIRMLYLQVKEHVRVQQKAIVCPGERYTFHGVPLSAPGEYVDTLSTIFGCDSVVVLELEMLPRRMLENDGAFAYLPNAFSPNDDGLNDLFYPSFSASDFIRYTFQIFDRWGNQVFSTSDPAASWDGRFRGKDCPPGVYTYFLVLKSETCIDAQYRGTVSLIK